MKRIAFIVLFVACSFSALYGQLTIDECQEKARMNYPQIKQFELIEKTAEYNISNANKAYLPQLSFSARATWQSDATAIDIPAMNLSVLTPKDQYQAVLEANQTLWDGGVTSSQKNIVKASAEVDKQKLEVDLYTIRERVNQLYFSLLLLDEQLLQNRILQSELQTNYEKVKTYMQNGIANQSDLDAVKLEMLNNGQRRTELKAAQKSYSEMLSAMIGEQIDEKSTMQKPSVSLADEEVNAGNRPEMKLFDSQLNLLDNQRNMVQAVNLPKFGLFMQGGFGKPGLNMLNSDFSPYFIGGIRLSWNISGLYTQKNNLNSLKINRDMVSTQKETFLFNTNLKISQQNAEIEKIRELVKSDDEIIRLHTSIKHANAVKVENGIKTVTDLLREINAESLAKQQKSLHEIQLLMNIYNLKYTTNK